jgi:hypothetical protein
MKLDPGMHIGMHLVSFGKSGVTLIQGQPRRRRALPLRRVDDGEGLRGAIRTGGGTKNWKREWLREQDRKGKNGSRAGVQEARTANAKCKGKKPPLLRL